MTVTTRSQIQFIQYVGGARSTFGPIAAPGVKSGDFIVAAWFNEQFGGKAPGSTAADMFRPLVVADDEITYIGSGDFTTADITIVLLRT